MLVVAINQRTVEAPGLSYSCVDPGGFESASFTVVQPPFEIRAGDDVLITDGPQVAWQGRVEEPGKSIQNNVLSYQVNCVGYGAELKENPFSFIWVDSDMSAWTGPTIARRIQLMGGNVTPTDASVGNDPSTGLPALILSVAGSWVAPVIPESTGQWDSGYGNAISAMFADWRVDGTRITTIAQGAAWWLRFFLSDIDTPVVVADFDITSPTGASGTIALSATTPSRRYAAVQLFFNATPGGSDGYNFEVYVTNMSIFGSHGLTARSDGVRRGLYLSDIVKDIVARSSRFVTRIDSNNLLVTQASYKTITDAESMIEDQRKLTGWHWGVWEPLSILSDTPSFWFTAPPSLPTTFTLVEDCTELDVTESYSAFHDKVIVQYTDSFGLGSFATASVPNSRIRQRDNHTLTVSIGVSTSAAAATFAQYVLDLDQSTTRAAGSCKLPSKLSDGRSSHMIRAGRDKIKIVDFPVSGPRTVDTIPTDIFHIARVSVTVENGTPLTQIEFDQGADLIEVLQARLVQGNSKIGF